MTELRDKVIAATSSRDPRVQAEANEWFVDWVGSPEAWKGALELLHDDEKSVVASGVNVLERKCRLEWAELEEDVAREVGDGVIEAFEYAMGRECVWDEAVVRVICRCACIVCSWRGVKASNRLLGDVLAMGGDEADVSQLVCCVLALGAFGQEAGVEGSVHRHLLARVLLRRLDQVLWVLECVCRRDMPRNAIELTGGAEWALKSASELDALLVGASVSHVVDTITSLCPHVLSLRTIQARRPTLVGALCGALLHVPPVAVKAANLLRLLAQDEADRRNARSNELELDNFHWMMCVPVGQKRSAELMDTRGVDNTDPERDWSDEIGMLAVGDYLAYMHSELHRWFSEGERADAHSGERLRFRAVVALVSRLLLSCRTLVSRKSSSVVLARFLVEACGSRDRDAVTLACSLWPALHSLSSVQRRRALVGPIFGDVFRSIMRGAVAREEDLADHDPAAWRDFEHFRTIVIAPVVITCLQEVGHSNHQSRGGTGVIAFAGGVWHDVTRDAHFADAHWRDAEAALFVLKVAAKRHHFSYKSSTIQAKHRAPNAARNVTATDDVFRTIFGDIGRDPERFSSPAILVEGVCEFVGANAWWFTFDHSNKHEPGESPPPDLLPGVVEYVRSALRNPLTAGAAGAAMYQLCTAIQGGALELLDVLVDDLGHSQEVLLAPFSDDVETPFTSSEASIQCIHNMEAIAAAPIAAARHLVMPLGALHAILLPHLTHLKALPEGGDGATITTPPTQVVLPALLDLAVIGTVVRNSRDFAPIPAPGHGPPEVEEHELLRDPAVQSALESAEGNLPLTTFLLSFPALEQCCTSLGRVPEVASAITNIVESAIRGAPHAVEPDHLEFFLRIPSELIRAYSHWTPLASLSTFAESLGPADSGKTLDMFASDVADAIGLCCTRVRELQFVACGDGESDVDAAVLVKEELDDDALEALDGNLQRGLVLIRDVLLHCPLAVFNLEASIVSSLALCLSALELRPREMMGLAAKVIALLCAKPEEGPGLRLRGMQDRVLQESGRVIAVESRGSKSARFRDEAHVHIIPILAPTLPRTLELLVRRGASQLYCLEDSINTNAIAITCLIRGAPSDDLETILEAFVAALHQAEKEETGTIGAELIERSAHEINRLARTDGATHYNDTREIVETLISALRGAKTPEDIHEVLKENLGHE